MSRCAAWPIAAECEPMPQGVGLGLSRLIKGGVERPNPLLRTHQFDLEEKGCIGRYVGRKSFVGIAQRGRNDELALAAHFHRHQAFDPTLDNRVDSETKGVGLSTVQGAVEFRSILESACVVYRDRLTLSRAGSAASDHIDVFQSRPGRDFFAVVAAHQQVSYAEYGEANDNAQGGQFGVRN